MRTAPDGAVTNGGLQWPRSIRMKASVRFALSDMSFPGLGERGLTLVDVQPNVCPSPACCTPAPNTATEHAMPSLMTSKYLAAL